MVIGIDLDNTIISYDAAFSKSARQLGYTLRGCTSNKTQIRNYIRTLDRGEDKWQTLQAEVYGPGIADAKLMPGVKAFILRCKSNDIPTFIVSHKTRFAHKSPGKTDLRTAAMSWLRTSGLIGPRLFEESDVYFEPTRALKLERIRMLRCTHFVDDLEETFFDTSFPQHVEKLLLSGNAATDSRLRSFVDWDSIRRYLFNV